MDDLKGLSQLEPFYDSGISLKTPKTPPEEQGGSQAWLLGQLPSHRGHTVRPASAPPPPATLDVLLFC